MREYRKDEQGKSTRDFVFQGERETIKEHGRRNGKRKRKTRPADGRVGTIRKQTPKRKEKEGGHDVTWLVQDYIHTYKLSRGEKEGPRLWARVLSPDWSRDWSPES